MMNSNEKEEGERLNINLERECTSSSQLYLGEIKRFISYYFTCLYYQKTMTDDQRVMKDRLNTIYQNLLLSYRQPDEDLKKTLLSQNLLDLFNTVMSYVKDGAQGFSSVWNASIKTLIKLLSFPDVIQSLASRVKVENEQLLEKEEEKNSQINSDQRSFFNLESLIQELISTQIDTGDHSEEEQKLLLKQKMLIKIVQTFDMVSNNSKFAVFKYILSVLKKKTLDDLDSYYSMQFGDAVKKNLHKVISKLMNSDIGNSDLKRKVVLKLMEKIDKHVKIIQKEDPKKPSGNLMKSKEYLCLLIKSLEDCFKKILSQKELGELIKQQKDKLIQTVCVTSESEDLMIRNQSQQLFTFLLSIILDQNIAIREELEIMIVKVVMKPALTLAKKLGASNPFRKTSSEGQNNSTSATPTQLSNDANKSGSFHGSVSSNSLGVQQPQLGHDSDYEDEDFIQIQPERSQQDDIQLELNMNFMLETLMLLPPQKISQLFLMYDCQPFSESVITKSLLLLLKYAQNKEEMTYKFFSCLIQMFQGVEFDQSNQANNSGIGIQMIHLMLEQKTQAKRLSKDLNEKYKKFLQKVEEMYSYLEPGTPAEVASKVLAYSREAKISNVIEVIGGKDDRAKRIMDAYLDKMDFSDGDIEQCMRRFLQTFRLAGVDSQVIFRIIQMFSHKFQEKDPNELFLTQVEAFDFGYLLIVLQTSQHNPNIKGKIDLKSFTAQALENLKESKDRIPPDFFEKIYNSVTNNSFFTPISRSLIEDNYNLYNQTEVQIRLSKVEGANKEILTENEFINSADLTQKQLFHYSNTLHVPPTLLPLATRYLISYLSQRFLKYLLSQPQSLGNTFTEVKFTIIEQLISLNRQHNNIDMVDKLFQMLYRVVVSSSNTMAGGSNSEQKQSQLYERLEKLLWQNFDCLRRSLILLPKLSSFMKDDKEVQGQVKEAINSAKRLIMQKHEAKRRKRIEEEQKQIEGGNQHGQVNKAPSFFDLVYNYFTDSAEKEDEREKERKLEIQELQTLQDIKSKLINTIDTKELLVDAKIEENEITTLQKSRLQELITLLCISVRDNLNQEEGTLCLAFLEHVIAKSDHSLETLFKLWIEMHLLISQSLKQPAQPGQNVNAVPEGMINAKPPGESAYEVISSTDSSQDSMDRESINGADNDIYLKDLCPIKTSIFESINRHLILKVHLSLTHEILLKKQGTAEGLASLQHLIREVQKIVNQIIEKEEPFYSTPSLFNYLLTFFEGSQQSLKTYPKLSKLIRLLLILILKSQTFKDKIVFADQLEENEVDSEDSDETGHLNSHLLVLNRQMSLFRFLSSLLSQMSPQLPFDLLTLSLDVFSNIQLPQYWKSKSGYIQQIYESALHILDNITVALQKQQHNLNEEAQVELWFHIIQTLQEKILLNQVSHNYVGLTSQIFNVIKNAVLSHPFDIEKRHYPIIRKLFKDILFQQTFEILAKVSVGLGQDEEHKRPINSELLHDEHKEDEDSDDNGDSNYKLEQMCMITVNNLSDIFIYYIASAFKEGISYNHNEAEASGDHQLFAFLWLHLLKVLLHYAEQGNSKDMHGLIVCSHDNIKRVIEFLIQSEILVSGGANEEATGKQVNPEMQKLWKTSWDIIGAFFTDMKENVLGADSEQQQQSQMKKQKEKATLSQVEPKAVDSSENDNEPSVA